MSMGHYKPYFDPNFDAHQEYRKEFVLKTYRKTSQKLQSSSYSKLFNDNSLRGVSAWLKEQATESDRKQFHSLFKKLGNQYEQLQSIQNPYTAPNEVDSYFHAASSFGHGVLTEKAIKSIATYFKENASTNSTNTPSTTNSSSATNGKMKSSATTRGGSATSDDMDSFKKMMSSITSYQRHIQPQSHEHSQFRETTPHVVDQKKSKPIQQVASEKYAMAHSSRPKTAPHVRPIVFPNEFTTTNNLTAAGNGGGAGSGGCLSARPSTTSHAQRMNERVFNSKIPFTMMAPSSANSVPTSKTDFSRSNSKVQEYSKAQPAWKATTCPTASGGVVQPAFSVNNLVQKEPKQQASHSSRKQQLPSVKTTTSSTTSSSLPIQSRKQEQKKPSVALGRTTYCSTFQPQTKLPSKAYHQTHYSKPFGDYGTVDFLTEYCKRYSSLKNKENSLGNSTTTNKVR